MPKEGGLTQPYLTTLYNPRIYVYEKRKRQVLVSPQFYNIALFIHRILLPLLNPPNHPLPLNRI